MQKLRSQSRLAICKPASSPIPILLALICFFNFSLICAAAIIKVPQDYSTIQSAIDAASDGDEIIVSPGTYYEHVGLRGKNIILRSIDPKDPSVVASTIIDGKKASNVVGFKGTESPACILSGFTITNGKTLEGGGIYGSGTMATIENNIIANNIGYSGPPFGHGGGMYACNGIIQGNTISDNTAGWGGGLALCYGIIQDNTISGNSALSGGGLFGCGGSIRNNTITDNWASWYGGGLSACHGDIQNNIISGNSTTMHGGGLVSCAGTIQNNTISGNSANDYGGGLSECDGFIINCIIWGNSASTDSQLYGSSMPFYSCIQDWTSGGRGNILRDPEFVNPLSGDYRLQTDSPCVDAGNTYYLVGEYQADIEGECRVAGESVDMGCDEVGGSFDSDGDLLSDLDEASKGSNKSLRDTDGDGLIDGAEILRGTSPTAADSAAGITIPEAYLSIQQGLFLAFPQETITILPGMYKENIHFLGKNLILQSSNPFNWDIVSSTTIDGEALFCVISFKGTEDSTCAVRGLTIRNGATYGHYGYYYGGGISGNGTLATIEQNNILANSAYRGGGIDGCDGLIRYNAISGNSAYSGGGLGGCDGVIEKNTISGNSASEEGGGLGTCYAIIRQNTISGNAALHGGGLNYCQGPIHSNIISANSAIWTGGGLNTCRGLIQNNLISANSAYSGGGLFGCDGLIQNNTIWGNSAQRQGGGLYYCHGTINNCILWQNTASEGPQLYNCPEPSYSCIQDWVGGGTQNISSDPELVDPGNGDFHLCPTSLCIDAGSTASLVHDFEGDPRPWNGTNEPRGDGSDFDIGADEYIGPIGFDFTTSQEGWTTGSAPVAFSVPQYIYGQGCVTIMSQNNTDTFGFWVSPESAIPVNQYYLYRARFVVSTDVVETSLVPQIRLRVNSRNFQQADCLTIDSNVEGGASPTPEGTAYDLYFVPPTNDEYCMLAFDLLNFNPYDAAHAELALESVLVERFPLDVLDESTTTVCTYDFEWGMDFWAPADGTFRFSDPVFLWEDGALHLRSMTNTNTFGFWHSDGIDVIVEENRLYRGTFEVRTDEPDRSRVPQMRLRFNTANMQVSRSLEIASFGDGANSPGTTNTTYDRLYFLPPANCVGEDLLVSFDVLNFNPGDAAEASLILDRATIETLSPPASP